MNILSVDLGASSGRVMRGVFSGDTLSLQEVRRFKNQPLRIQQRMYWNIYSLFQEMKWGIAEAVQTHGEMASLAIDSWAVDFGLLNKDGCLLDLPRHYREPKNVQAMTEVVEKVGREYLFQRAGIQLNPINTLYQLYAMQKDSQNLLSAAERLLLIPDLLNFFLSGQQAVEFTNATTTQFLCPSGEWDIDLLSQLNLPTNMLPPIAQPGTVLGRVTDEELLQIPSFASTKIVHTASHDTAAAVLSIPHMESSFAYISSGTWSLMGTLVDQPVINQHTQTFNLTNEGGLGNYRLLKNVMGLWLVQETQRALQAIGEPFDIEWLVHQAELATPFACLFNPDDTRLLQPNNMQDAICQICRETGQTIPAGAGQLMRGIFESLALKYRQVLEELEFVTGQRYEAIHIVGGGSQNQLLSQFTANATGRMIVTGPVEASAMGNILGQLVALGEIDAKQMSDLVRRSVEPVTYVPQGVELWDAAYETFRAIGVRQLEQSMSI